MFTSFQQALPMPAFLSKYGHAVRWQNTYDHVRLNEHQIRLLKSFRREMNVLILAGAWCGDCSSQCPILERFAEQTPTLTIRYLDNAEHPALQEALSINGGKRVPVVLFFSEDGFEVARFGERPLSAYRHMAADLPGFVAPLTDVSDTATAVIQDWLDIFERVQLLLRLSSRLRLKHGD